MSTKVIILLAALLLGAFFCNKNPADDDDNPGGAAPPSNILPAYYGNPAWHPGGIWIATSHEDSIDTSDDGQYDEYFSGIWLVHAETGAKQPLIRWFGHPAWSPDGTQLAMEAGGHIFTIEVSSLEPAFADTNTLQQLTEEGRNFFPAWSSDGKMIAYSRSICEGDSTCGVWVVSSGSKENRFIDNYGMYPTWHPVKIEILYKTRAVTSEGKVLGDTLWTSDIKTKAVYFLVFLSGQYHDNSYPKYSPNGGSIAFQSAPEGSHPAIWTMNHDGTHLRELIEGPAWGPAWSPDGKQVAFIRHHLHDYIPGNGHLWLFDIATSKMKQLTFN